MRIFLTLWGLFTIALTVHLSIWKLCLPRYQYQMKVLLLIFGAVFCLWLLGFAATYVSPAEFLNIALAYISLSLGYIVVYSAINVDSPTLSLMRFLAKEQEAGRSADEVDNFLAQRPFVKRRLGTLIDSGLIREKNSRWMVAGKGSVGFRFILSFRKLYGPISKGG